MAWPATTDQILNADGVRQRIDTFRFDLRDQATREVIGTVHPSRDRPPTVSNQTGRSVRRQLASFELPTTEAGDVSTLADEVQPWMVLQNGAEISLGVFRLADRNSPIRPWGLERSVTWGDKMTVLDRPITKSIGWGKGADIALATAGLVLQVLTLDDLGPAPSSSTVFGAPVAYNAGTSRLRIVEDFAALMGWLPPYFDRDGLLRFVAVPDLDTAAPTTVSFGPAGPGRIVRDSILRSDELLTAPNQFVVVESSGRSNIRGVYNVPASAPHSAANRAGLIVPAVFQVQGLSSTSQANKVARAKAMTAGKIYEWLTMDVLPDPRFDTWDIVPTMDIPPIIGPEQWVALEWALRCRAGGRTPLKLRKVY